MLPAQLEQTTPISIELLRELSGSPGPCITAVFALHHEDTRQVRLAVKKALEAVEQGLERRRVPRKQAAVLMEPLRTFAVEVEKETEHKGIVILRSPDLFEHYFVPREMEDSITIAGHFHLLPLIPLLREGHRFYILALSQKHVRLLRCTNTTSEVLDLPPSMPSKLDEFLETDQPDHVLDNASAGGPGASAMVTFGTAAEKERRDEHLLHFYREVDRGITELLKNDTAPLVPAGVEYEQVLYRGVSRFPRLVAEGVRGAADGLKGGEVHKRALELMPTHWRREVDRALEMFEQFGGSNRASLNLREIVKSAYEGRILHLFVQQGVRHRGNFDEMTHQVRSHRQEQAGEHTDDEDLINAAAVETLRHNGNVYVIPANRVPHGSQLAAVMRY